MADNEVTIESLTAENAAMQVKLDEATSSTASMKAKMDELLGETKAAKAARVKIEADALIESERIAKEKGDFEALHRSAEERYLSTQKELTDLRGGISKANESAAGMKLAAKLADGVNAELLADFITRRLKSYDDGIKITDSSGNLTVATMADLESEFKNDSRYASLMRGNQSSGGGASGNQSGGGAAKTMTRAELTALSPADQSKVARSGVTITHD